MHTAEDSTNMGTGTNNYLTCKCAAFWTIEAFWTILRCFMHDYREVNHFYSRESHA